MAQVRAPVADVTREGQPGPPRGLGPSLPFPTDRMHLPSRHRLLQAAAWAALALAVAAPAWQFGQGWQAARDDLQAQARWQAALLRPVTDGNRDDWPAAVNALLDSLPGQDRRHVVDGQGRLVGSTTVAVPWPALETSAPVGTGAQLTLTRSMQAGLLPAALLSLAWLAAAATLAGAARRNLHAAEPATPWARWVFDHSRDGIVIVDDLGTVRQANAAAAMLFGETDSERVAGQPLSRWLTSPMPGVAGRHAVHLRRHGRGGDPLPCELTWLPSPASDGSGPLWVATLRDLTERVAAERRLRMMADYDSLTGLPNRSLFRDRLGQALGRAQRSGMSVALMFLDLDRFKHVNDSLGHDAGDRLLQHVAGTLAATLRSGDSVARLGTAGPGREDPFTVARLGGDEFTVVVEDLPHAEEAAVIAERLLRALEQPFMIGTQELVITGSIGLTVYPADPGTPEDLLQHADLAMYRAKELGRNAVQFYSEAMNERARERMRLEGELRHALERGEFTLHYQPKADVATQAISGVEALLRWQRDGVEVATPDVFVPLLEDSGLILPVGHWVMSQAAEQVCAWRRAGLPWVRVAVNLSARQLRQADLVATVAEVLESTGLPSAQLELELTESMLMDGAAHAETLASLSALGVLLAIDDFGTGYSSLSYLKRFNLNSLKIDRSFVTGMPHDLEDRAIAQAVIALARSLKLRVVAEGVQTEAQRSALAALGCDEMQGWLLGRPMPADAYEAWWRDRLAAPVLQAVVA